MVTDILMSDPSHLPRNIRGAKMRFRSDQYFIIGSIRCTPRLSKKGSTMADKKERRSHPMHVSNNSFEMRHQDSHALDDWFMYGSKDSRIEQLVRSLALTHGMRIFEIENLIVETLQAKIDSLD